MEQNIVKKESIIEIVLRQISLVGNVIVWGFVALLLLALSLSAFITGLDAYWREDAPNTVTGVFMGWLFAYLGTIFVRYIQRKINHHAPRENEEPA